MINIKKINEVYMELLTDNGTLKEISEEFTYFAPNYKFHPKYKKRQWNGKISLISNKRFFPIGILPELVKFLKKNSIEYQIEGNFYTKEFSEKEALDFIKTLNIPEKFTIRDYQIQYFVKCVRNSRLVCVSPTNCHAKGDKIFTSNGWKFVEDIKVNDLIIGSDGKEKKILKTFSGYDDMYEIIPSGNKESIKVTKNHILPIKFSDKTKKHGYNKQDENYIEYISVEDYIKKSKYYKHCSNLFYNNSIVEYENKLDSILTPYFIGLYLGDGSKHQCQITTKDSEIINEINDTANNLNLSVRYNGNFGYSLVQGKGKRHIIFEELEKIGIIFGKSYNKKFTNCEDRFIPEPLFHITSKERLEFLAGLIDSDGYLANNTCYEYTSKSIRLCQDVQRLAISLGFSTRIKTKLNKKYNKNYYTTSISGNLENIPVRISRKKLIKNNRTRNSQFNKFVIEYIGKDNFYGFEVEDHLYITNDGMITHNSGKSMLQYLLFRYYNEKTLLIVPTIALVTQMYHDFLDYGYQEDNDISLIMEGSEKSNSRKLTISTYQSITNLEPEWFENFKLVLGDEVHTFAANSLKKIMNNLIFTPYRFGVTGTLSNEELSNMTIKSSFGSVIQYITQKELIERKFSSEILIKCVELIHSDCEYFEMTKDTLKKINYEYKTEIDYLLSCKKRNNFIKNLALSLKGNTFVTFRQIDHGKILYDNIKEESKIPVFFVDGSTSAEERESIRNKIEKLEESITVCSVVFSTGINIKRINNMIFTHPSKSRIRNLQTIGRGLRKVENKELLIIDISDRIFKKSNNFTLNHSDERKIIYKSESFPFKEYKVNLLSRLI